MISPDEFEVKNSSTGENVPGEYFSGPGQAGENRKDLGAAESEAVGGRHLPQIPLSSCSDATFFKTYGADLGLLRRNAGVGYRTVLTEPEGYASFKCAFTENYCMTELTTLGIRPYYWRSGNSAEVDFLLEDSLNRIMPLEVKSADNTRAKSLATYCRQYKPELAFKVSAKNIGDNQKGDTHEISLPLYLLWRLPVYIGQ